MKLKEFLDRHPFLKYWDPVILYGVLLLSVAFWPTTPSPERMIGWNIASDLKHIMAYFGFSFLLGWAARHSRFEKISSNHYLFAMIVAVIVGVADESIQVGVSGRHAAASDVLMDSVGAISAQILRWTIKREKRIIDRIF